MSLIQSLCEAGNRKFYLGFLSSQGLATFFPSTDFLCLEAVGVMLEEASSPWGNSELETHIPFQRSLSKCYQKWSHMSLISGQTTVSLMANFRYTFVGWLIYMSQSYMIKNLPNNTAKNLSFIFSKWVLYNCENNAVFLRKIQCQVYPAI